MNRTMPATEAVLAENLELGDAIITPLPNGLWSEGIVYFLSEQLTSAGDGDFRQNMIYATAPYNHVMDRLLRPSAHRLRPLPIHAAVVEHPLGHVTTRLVGQLKPKPYLYRATQRERLFFNGIDPAVLSAGDMDLRTLRHVARTLKPGVYADLQHRRGNGLSRIKAVGIGINGAIGILPQWNSIKLSETAVRPTLLPSDTWLNAAETTFCIVDTDHNDAPVKTFHYLKRVLVPHA